MSRMAISNEYTRLVQEHMLSREVWHLAPLTNAITKAFTGNQASSTPEKRAVASQQSSQCGISPSKVADVCMKNLEQLKFLHQLYEDGILSHTEFIEQKGIILDLLRKLN